MITVLLVAVLVARVDSLYSSSQSSSDSSSSVIYKTYNDKAPTKPLRRTYNYKQKGPSGLRVGQRSVEVKRNPNGFSAYYEDHAVTYPENEPNAPETLKVPVQFPIDRIPFIKGTKLGKNIKHIQPKKPKNPKPKPMVSEVNTKDNQPPKQLELQEKLPLAPTTTVGVAKEHKIDNDQAPQLPSATAKPVETKPETSQATAMPQQHKQNDFVSQKQQEKKVEEVTMTKRVKRILFQRNFNQKRNLIVFAAVISMSTVAVYSLILICCANSKTRQNDSTRSVDSTNSV